MIYLLLFHKIVRLSKIFTQSSHEMNHLDGNIYVELKFPVLLILFVFKMVESGIKFSILAPAQI